MMYSQFSSRRRVFVKRVASFSVFSLSVFLAGCSAQGISFEEVQAQRYQQYKSASQPIPSEPVYGYADRETLSSTASNQQPVIQRKKLAPVQVASLDNNYVGSSFAMQPVSSYQQSSGTSAWGGKRYAQSGPAYYAQPEYLPPQTYRDDSEDDYKRDVPERYTHVKQEYPAHADEGYYTVVEGDTVYSLARRFGMTTTDLAELNGIIGSKIYVGQRLRVSGKTVYTSSNRYGHPQSDNDREVDEENEAYEKDEEDLPEEQTSYDYEERKSPPPRRRSYRSNDDYDRSGSQSHGSYKWWQKSYDESGDEAAGNKSHFKKTAGTYGKYTVRRGDSLYSIAHDFGLNHLHLAAFNDISASGKLLPGQVLRVPHLSGKAPDYERKVTEETDETEDGYRKRRPRRARYEPANNSDDLPYWKRRSASRPGKADAEREVVSAESATSRQQIVADESDDDEKPEPRPVAKKDEAEEPVLAAHRDVKAADAKPKQAQTSIGQCNDLLEKPAPRSAKTFREPVQGLIVAKFGSNVDDTVNDGIDFSVPKGTPVMAAENGVIAYTGNELPGFGKLILVRHADGFVTAYAHNDEILVNRCDVVKRGQIIAKAGATGKVTKPRLHFELRKDAKPIDPEGYFTRS